MKNKSGIVYIVHHVDTEGPLWESTGELFARLKIIFGIDLKPTRDNLVKLQQGAIDLPEDIKKEVLLAVDPHTIEFKKNWYEVEEMLLRVMSSKFRNEMIDSFGGGWIYNWHIMDHIGFVDNPRHRDFGFLNVFDFYGDIIKRTQAVNDSIHWHFHPIPFYKQAHIPAACYDNSLHVLHEIIARRVIDRNWFPVVNRAGFHTIRPDSNLFLEQWIPFDSSNQSTEDDLSPKYQKDLIMGRFGDWRGAPSDWSLYHPDYYDWRKKGNCNRVIGRVLNLKSRHRSINESEIEKAFKKAFLGENVYMGITNHDWREMSVEIDEFRAMLSRVAKGYPDISFKFSESVEAFREVLGYSAEEIRKNTLDFHIQLNGNILEIDVTSGEIFGPQPYLAIKTKENKYFHDNVDFQIYNKKYSYVFDDYTINLESISSIVVASNDEYGNTCIRRIDI